MDLGDKMNRQRTVYKSELLGKQITIESESTVDIDFDELIAKKVSRLTLMVSHLLWSSYQGIGSNNELIQDKAYARLLIKLREAATTNNVDKITDALNQLAQHKDAQVIIKAATKKINNTGYYEHDWLIAIAMAVYEKGLQSTYFWLFYPMMDAMNYMKESLLISKISFKKLTIIAQEENFIYLISFNVDGLKMPLYWVFNDSNLSYIATQAPTHTTDIELIEGARECLNEAYNNGKNHFYIHRNNMNRTQQKPTSNKRKAKKYTLGLMSMTTLFGIARFSLINAREEMKNRPINPNPTIVYENNPTEKQKEDKSVIIMPESYEVTREEMGQMSIMATQIIKNYLSLEEAMFNQFLTEQTRFVFQADFSILSDITEANTELIIPLLIQCNQSNCPTLVTLEDHKSLTFNYSVDTTVNDANRLFTLVSITVNE